MEPTSFDEANHYFGPPKGMTEDQVATLAAHRAEMPDGQRCVITCWKPAQAEIDEIQKTGRVWVWVFGGALPPMALEGFTPFKQRDPENDASD